MTEKPSALMTSVPEKPFTEVEASLEKSGRVEELIRLYESRSREVPSADEAAHLLCRAAELAHRRLKNPVRAEELLQRSLVYAPGSRESLDGLKVVYEQRNDPGALAETLERLALATPGSDAAPLYLRAGELQETRLGRRDRAVICYQLASRAAPKDRQTYVRARRILVAEGRSAPAFESLERQRAALGDRDLVEDYVAFAEELVNHPKDHGLATRALVRALAVEGRHPKAIAVQKELSKLEYVWRERVKVLKARSLEERDRRAAARLSLVVARLYAFYEPTAIDRVKEAIDRCFALWPAMPAALDLLQEVAEKTGDLRAALTIFSKLAAETRDRQAKVELNLRIGQLLLSKLDDRAEATAAFEQAAKLDPSRPDAAMLASELLVEAGRTEEGIAVIERHLATLQDRRAQVVLRLNLADLAQKRLGNPSVARAQLEAALKLDPNNALVAWRLVSLLIEVRDLDAVWPMLELAVSAPRSIAARVALCEQIGALCETAGDPKRAFAALSLALPLDPSNGALLAHLGKVAAAGRVDSQLVGSLRRAAQVAPPQAQVPLWRALAQLLQRLERPAEAREALLEVKRRAPDDGDASAALAAIEKALAEEPQDPRSRLEAEARRLEASAADPAAAADVYRKILELDPDSVLTLKKLGAAATNLGRWEEVATVAERLLALADSPQERQEWRARLAQLYAERLNRKDEAARLYLDLLGEGVDSAAVVSGLERLAAQGIRQADVSRALAPVYARAGDHQRQVASLLVQLASVQSKDEQKSLLSLLAETTETRLLDVRAAYELRVRGLALDPGDSTFRAEAVRLARGLKSQEELARFLIELASKVADDAVAVPLLGEAGALADEADAFEDAATALKAGLAKSPGNQRLLAQLCDVYSRAKRWNELDGALRARLEVAEDDERAPLLLGLEQVNAELKRPKEAAAALAEAVKAGALELEHLPRLAQRYEDAGLYRELTEVLARLSTLHEQAGDHERASAAGLRRAKILETALGDKAEAIRRYGDVLSAKPSDPDALGALENLLLDSQHGEAAARTLLPAYEVANDYRKQVAALAVIARSSNDQLERLTALRRSAEIHLVRLRLPVEAFAALADAMRLAPDDAALRAQARSAAEDSERLDRYAAVLEELVETSGPEAAALHRELADVYERELDRQDAAVHHLHAVLGLDPKNADTLKALLRLHRAREEWAELVPLLERAAMLEADPAARSTFDREAALVSEQRLGDLERAAANWRQIASRDVLAKEAASALDRLYSALDRPHELAFALELRRNQEGQSPLGRELAFRLATLRHSRLGDLRGALEVFRQILSEDPAHQGTRDALETWAQSELNDGAAAGEILDPVLARTGDHQRRIAIREARLDHATSGAERARLLAEIRGILERDLDQPQAAFLSALKAFTEGLDRLELQGELERLARVTGSFEELAEIFETVAPTSDEAQRIALFRRAAELREQLGEMEDATRDLKAILEDAPQDRQALEALGRIYERSQNARSLSEVYARQAELANDPAERFLLLGKTAEAFEAVGEDHRAIESLKTALALKQARPVLVSLDRLLARTHRFEEEADVLDQLATITEGPAERLGLVLQRAELLEREEQIPEALRAYAAALELLPQERQAVAGLERLLENEAVKQEAARLLEPCYRAASEWKKLVEILEVRLHVADVRRRVPLMMEIASLREAVGPKSSALVTRLRAFVEAPGSQEVREELERLVADLGAFEELARAYEEALQHGPPEPLGSELWRRLATIYGDRLGRFDLAAKAWNEVLAKNPKDLVVLETLGRIFRRTNQFRELSIVMRRQLALETNTTVQVNLLFELATLAEETLADKALAAQCYQAILERKPDDSNATKLLSLILGETERWPELAAVLSKEIELAERRHQEEEAHELMVRLGRLKLSRLSDPRGALTTLQEVLRRKPTHAGAIGALEEMARSDNPLRGEAASTLEPVFAKEGDHLKHVQMLEARVAAEPSAAGRAELLRKVAELYAREMGNEAMAFVAAARALKELPDEPKNLDLALAHVAAADADDELVSLLSEVAPRASSDTARAGLYRALARLQAQQDEEQAAVESWKRVLELAPTDAEAMDQVGSLLARQGRVPELYDVLKRQLTVEEDLGRRVALMFQLGALQEEQLRDPGAAITTFRRLLELKPDDLQALARMERLCEAQERWPELADAISKRLKVAPLSERLELSLKLAMVRETRLLDRPGALTLYQELLAQDPQHPGALSRLEAMVQREPQHQAAVDVLLDAYRRSGDVQKLVAAIDARVTVSPDAVERKQLLTEQASVREAQGAPELAYLGYYRAYREDPNDKEVRAKLVSAAAAAESWDELSHALSAELPRVGDPTDAAEVLLLLGQVSEQRLGEKEEAVAFYERALRTSEEIGARALPALDRLYGALGDASRQADVLETLAARATDPLDRVALNFRLGQLSVERLENPDRAAAAYERVLETDPRHLPSLRSLEALYEQAKANDKLFENLKAQRELVAGPERERVLGKMALVSAEGLSNVDNSVGLYRELLQQNSRNEQAFEALLQLLDQAKRPAEVKDLLVWKLQFTIDPRELVRLNDRLGRVLMAELKAPEEAAAAFRSVLERDPRHKGALEALRDIYDELGKRDELVLVLRRLIPIQETATDGKRIRIRLAELMAQTARREEALDAGRRALEVDPHTVEELDRLVAVFTSLKAWMDTVRTLEIKSGVLRQLGDTEGATKAMFEVAAIWRGPAGKAENAGPALEKVLEIEPANREAWEEARTLYASVNDWRSWAQVVDHYLPHLVTDDEKVAALKELGQVQESKLGAKHVAFLQYCRALQLVPSDDAIREQVERLASETNSYEELAAVYEEVGGDVPAGPLAERMFLTLAGVQDTRLDDPEAAEQSLRRILEFDPTNETALKRLSTMFARRGRNTDYILSLEQTLEAAGSLEQRKEILREIARVYDEQLERPDEAENALVRALELEPDLETFGVLVALQRRQKSFSAVASSLLRMRDISSDPLDRARLQVEVAQVSEHDLGDDEAAIEGYRLALEFDPANGAALGALERLYTKLDRPAELLAVYERQLELTQDYRERVTLLFRSAAIWEERYQNLANADACVDAALQVDPQNLQAIKTLERLRKAQGRWEELVGVIDRHLQLLTLGDEKAELCVEMGDIFHQQLKAVDRAVTAYHQALEFDPGCRPAMHALGTLYERSGNWPFALEMLEREAHALGSTGDAVELWYRMGKINEDMLIDLASARHSFLEALRIDAAYLPAIRSLKGIYESERDWVNFEKALVEEARQTEDPLARSTAWIEVGRYHQSKENTEEATTAFEEALTLVPDALEAAQPLSDIYLSKEQWPRCEQMLDIVVEKLHEQYGLTPDNQDLAKEVCRRSYRLGYVSEKNSHRDKALLAYERAWQLDSTYLPVLEGYGNLLVQTRRFEEALKIFTSILGRHRNDLTDLEVAEIHWTIGDLYVETRQTDRAVKHFEMALAIDQSHEPSLRSMVGVTEAAQNFDKAAEFRQRLLGVLEGDARYDEGVALGKLAKEKLADPYMAIDAYLAAYRIKPEVLEVMDALYVLYRETKQGAKAAEMLEKMLAVPSLQEDVQRAKRVWFALGEINRDELGDIDKATQCFNRALDLDWRFIEAFSALEAMLGRNKRWRNLDENYKKMISRLPKTEETHVPRMTLWRALGDLYLNVLKAPDSAVEVYKVVAAGLPDNVELQEQFAQLAQTQPGYEQLAVEAWRRALPATSNPGKVASALAELAAKRKDYDSAWLAAQVMSGLIGEVGPGEKEILSKLGPYAKKREIAQRPVTDRLWAEHLFHPKMRGPLSELFGILFEQAHSLYKEDPAKYGINPKKHLLDVAQAPEFQMHQYRYVAKLLGLEQVPVYSPFLVAKREQLSGRTNEAAPDPLVGVEICHTDPAAIRLGGRFFQETGPKELQYLVGRTLAMLRPELALAQRLSAERLEAVLQAAISLSVDRFRFTADRAAIDAERRLLDRALTQQARSALARVTQAYVQVSTPNDLRNYLEGVELSAARAGALVAGEIEPVKKMVMAESGGTFRVPPRSKIRDLMVFALGEDLHVLRNAIGTSVEVQTRK